MFVLIVTNNASLASDIGDYLELRGDEPDFASDAELGLRLCDVNRYHAIVLDCRLPNVDGVTFCRRLRHDVGHGVPVLMLAPRDSVADRIRGLEAGADDCLSQPFSRRELYLRLRALARRPAATDNQLCAGGLRMDPDQRRILAGEAAVELAPISFRILELLVRAFPRIVTRTEFESAIWKDNPPESDAALRGHIHRLRQLLDKSTGHGLIKTVHGVGYQLLPLN